MAQRRERERQTAREPFAARVVGGLGRFVVSLTWAVLLVVVVFVVYLALRFYR